MKLFFGKNNSHIIYTACLFTVIFMSAASSVAETKPRPEKPLLLVGDIPETSKAFRALSFVYTDAFNRIGKAFVFRQYPGKRAALMTEKGLADGQLSRVFSFSTRYQSVVRVEEPIYKIKILALTVSPEVNITNLRDLKDTRYSVNYKRGSVLAEKVLTGVVPPKQLELVNTYQSGLKKLVAGRTDLFIANEAPIAGLLLSEEFKSSEIRIESVLYETTAHLFLHKKHKALAPKLSRVFKEIKKEGLIEKYKKQAGFQFILPQ